MIWITKHWKHSDKLRDILAISKSWPSFEATSPPGPSNTGPRPLGRALAVSGAVKDARGLLVTWFLGTQTGGAVADVLFGDYNPSGAMGSGCETYPCWLMINMISWGTLLAKINMISWGMKNYPISKGNLHNPIWESHLEMGVSHQWGYHNSWIGLWENLHPKLGWFGSTPILGNLQMGMLSPVLRIKWGDCSRTDCLVLLNFFFDIPNGMIVVNCIVRMHVGFGGES